MPGILIIDDDHDLVSTLKYFFSSRGWDTADARNGEQGVELVERMVPDIVLLDMKLPDVTGMEVLKRLRAKQCPSSIILVTGWGSIADAVEAIKLGAEQYLTKPVNLVELSTLTERIIETRKLRIENLFYQQRLDHPVVGVSTEIYRLHHMIALMAENTDTTVLLNGESGTGKELVAREIHRRSARHERPFLDINCAVMSETLLESQMFGHERGAFTDARERKLGLLEIADGGTVFLDEIGEMPLSVQPKLLRVLETRIFRRIGGTKDIHVNVRIIAATNRDLARAVSSGHFREDLYYRLKVFPVDIPPLRARPADIPVLIQYFVNHFNEALKKNISGFTPEAMECLQTYSWPGNVRELKNVVERAMVLSRNVALDKDILPNEVSGLYAAAAPADLQAPNHPQAVQTLEERECEYIAFVLRSQGGNRSMTAKLLGIARSTLQEKLKKYGLEKTS